MKNFYFQELEAAERSAREIRENFRSVMQSFFEEDLPEEFEISDLYIDLWYEEIL